METGRLSIVIDDGDDCPLITAVGDLDAAATSTASGYIARRVAAAPTSDWLFDLSGVEFVDSSGIQLLLIVQQAIAPGGSLTLLNPAPALRRLFALVGLDNRFATITTGQRDLCLTDRADTPPSSSIVDLTSTGRQVERAGPDAR